ncbi:hypothetical protein GCM10010403_40680 [Glycomyces rutgersensis]|uniref:Uncharacterized protein n=1 Tax=Glycomyces rutgersensis TaxID=58115 RepID=A0ABN3G3L0_9ACTN
MSLAPWDRVALQLSVVASTSGNAIFYDADSPARPLAVGSQVWDPDLLTVWSIEGYY